VPYVLGSEDSNSAHYILPLLRLVLFQVQLLLVRFLLVLVLLLVLQLVELLVYGMVCMNPMKHINAHIIHV
jgi:hypothetical protein